MSRKSLTVYSSKRILCVSSQVKSSSKTRKAKEKEKRICAFCGNLFTPDRTELTCSKSCNSERILIVQKEYQIKRLKAKKLKDEVEL